MDENVLKSSLDGAWSQIVEGMSQSFPRLLIFLGLVAVGWVLAYLLRAWIIRLVGGLERLIRNRAIKTELGELGHEIGIRRTFPELLGELVFWIVLLFFLIAATESLGLPVLSGFTSGFTRFFPNILAGVVILLLGIFIGGLARKALSAASARAAVGDPVLLGRAAQGLVILTAVLMGIEQIGIHAEFLTTMIYLTVGGLFVGLSLAFALGSRRIVGNMIASQYLLRTHRVGQMVRIGDIRGTIREVTTTAVVVETKEGRVFIPASKFQEEPSILTSDED